ncbi:HDIG domain protein [Candidatus Burkholderia humilis]|nr:HDIG domain protein [Candidatus Burkholderia humilis]
MVTWQGHFDKRIFNAFVKTVGIYPVGSLVRLASGYLAVVVAPSGVSLLAPSVRAFFSLRSKERIIPRLIDLSAKRCTESIVGIENAADWGLESVDDVWLYSA